MEYDLWNKPLTKSTDWQLIEKNLVDVYLDIATLSSTDIRELRQLRQNLGSHVSEISKMEVSARRSKNPRELKKSIEQFNQTLSEIRWMIMTRILS